MATKVGSIMSKGGLLVNDHDHPPEHSYFFGKALLIGSSIAAGVDTLGSGWALLNIFWFLAPGINQSGAPNIIIFALAFFLAVLIYLMAQSALFMASGHAETRANSMGDERTHGIMARKATSAGTILFFRKYRAYISTGSMVYMICTDLYGLFAFFWPWMWKNADPTGSTYRMGAGFVIFGIITIFFFLVALNGPLYGLQQMQYAKEEEQRIKNAWNGMNRAAPSAGSNGQGQQRGRGDLLVQTEPPQQRIAGSSQQQRQIAPPPRQGGTGAGSSVQASRSPHYAQPLREQRGYNGPRQAAQRTDEIETAVLAQQGRRGQPIEIDEDDDQDWR